MTRKQTMRLLTMLLVCIILLNFIAQPKAEAIGGSLALALGGTSAAKAFLAFIMSCVAMGVTYVTIDDAMAAYDHYIENASVSIEDLRYVQQETWTGNYESVANELTDIHSGIKSWLEGLFGTLTVGNNIVTNGINVDNRFNVSTRSERETINKLNYYITVNGEEKLIFSYNSLSESTTYKYTTFYATQISDSQFTLQQKEDRYVDGVFISTRWLTFYINETIFPIGWNNIQTDLLPTYTTTITSDAPILNPSYSPQNRTFPPAPYLPYINPGNEKISQSISAAGGTMEVYSGTYDQYLDDVVENATWEDIQGVISGSVPTTTLTETSEGLIIGEATAGIPYPIPDTTAPGEVLTGLGGIMGLLQGITNWIAQLWQLISGIFAIPEGLALDFSSLRLEGFKDKFPFSIPWDIYRAVAVFAKTPETPEFNIDIETDYLNIDHTINLDPIDLPLRFARYVMSIFFIFFLASKTRDLIKW